MFDTELEWNIAFSIIQGIPRKRLYPVLIFVLLSAGTLEWQEKNRTPAAANAGPKVSRSLPCEVCINAGDTEL
jgi:hypothetical protein